jgi:hypothetical protein
LISSAKSASDIETVSEERVAFSPVEAPTCYCILQADSWSYSVSKSTIWIGRQAAEFNAATDEVALDVCLNSKLVSRRHAKFQYNFQLSKWQIVCVGRNGIVVNQQFHLPSPKPVPLKDG